VAAPAIGRYQAFANLFAAAGETVHRLDRHPTMSVHPVTPMDEADVTRHLARQTDRRIGLVDLRALKAGRAAQALAAELAAGATVVALDVVDAETLAEAGALLWDAVEGGQLFAVGSQGVEYALVAAWQAAGLGPPAPSEASAGPVERVAVVSGSCSPWTAHQIERAEEDGFAAIPLDARAVLDPGTWEAERERVVTEALRALDDGRDPLVHSARGPDDPAVAAFREAGGGDEAANARLGKGLGEVLMAVVREAKLTRVAIAGGDTSSAAARGLGLHAVSAAAPLAPGAALLRGHGEDPATDGIEIALKGGQMGPPRFFQHLRAGGPGGDQ
jgi:uncharacterized protein YgbK (DUF1537 family)